LKADLKCISLSSADGTLDKDSLKDWYEKLVKLLPELGLSVEGYDSWFKDLDSDEDGHITFKEVDYFLLKK